MPATLHNLTVLPQKVTALDARGDHWIEGESNTCQMLRVVSAMSRSPWAHPSPRPNRCAGSLSIPE